MKILKRPDILFLLAGLLLFILCLFGGQTLDINIHDTYFVIAYFHIGLLLFFIHALFALVYFLLRRHQNYKSGLLHLVLGLPLFINIVFPACFFMVGAPRRYYANTDVATAFDTSFPGSAYVIVSLFILGQFLFLFHIIVSVIKAIKPRTGKE